MSLADQIETYLKECLRTEPAGCLEIQRRRVAGFFGCAPSQINYVLATRFSVAQGYRVESRRGGGGYVRISRNHAGRENRFRLDVDVNISQDAVEQILTNLAEEGVLTSREAALVTAAVGSIPSMTADGEARAGLLRAMLKVILDNA